MTPLPSGDRDNCGVRSRHIPSQRSYQFHEREPTTAEALARTLPIATMMQYVVSFSSSRLQNYKLNSKATTISFGIYILL